MSSMYRDFTAGLTAFDAPLDARLAFIRRTYVHVTGAALAFVAASWLALQAGLGVRMLEMMSGGGRVVWLAILGAFMLVGWMAQAFAHRPGKPALQYLGLALYVGIEAVIFAPLIAYATAEEYAGTLPTAAGLTVLAFGALSAYVLTTKKDFSFLRTAMFVGSLVALGLIVVSAIVGFNLGIWFSGAMILFAIGAVLYSTSNVLHTYRTDQHVAASLQLFAAVALLFYYVLMFLLQSRRN